MKRDRCFSGGDEGADSNMGSSNGGWIKPSIPQTDGVQRSYDCPPEKDEGAAIAPWENFETAAAAIAEDELRIKQLRWNIRSADSAGRPTLHRSLNRALRSLPELKPKELKPAPVLALIEALNAGLRDDADAKSLGSSVAMRAIRERVITHLLEAFEGYSDGELKVSTVIKSKWAFTQKRLAEVSAAKIKHEFMIDLRNNKISTMPGPLVAFLHGEFEPTSGLYILHYHVLTTSNKAEALRRLAKRRDYTPTHTGAVPVRVDSVRHRFRQCSYLLKAFWMQRAFRDETGKRDRNGVRIAEPYHSLYLLWLDRQRLADLTIMNGCWSRKSGGPAAMKALYLSIYGGWGKAKSG